MNGPARRAGLQRQAHGAAHLARQAVRRFLLQPLLQLRRQSLLFNNSKSQPGVERRIPRYVAESGQRERSQSVMPGAGGGGIQ